MLLPTRSVQSDGSPNVRTLDMNDRRKLRLWILHSSVPKPNTSAGVSYPPIGERDTLKAVEGRWA